MSELLQLSFCHDFTNQCVFGGPFLKTPDGIITDHELAIGELRRRTAGAETLFLICGFNSDSTNALASYAKLIIGLQTWASIRYEQVVGVLWPGQLTPGYAIAELVANQVGTHLRDVIRELACSSIDIEAHSLGNRIALEVNKAGDPTIQIRNLILTNAAVDDESIERDQTYSKSVSTITGRSLVLYSTLDTVLRYAYRVGATPRNWTNLWGSHFRFFGDRALGYSGPEHGRLNIPSTMKLLDASAWCLEHSDARNHPQLYQAWESILS